MISNFDNWINNESREDSRIFEENFLSLQNSNQRNKQPKLSKQLKNLTTVSLNTQKTIVSTSSTKKNDLNVLKDAAKNTNTRNTHIKNILSCENSPEQLQLSNSKNSLKVYKDLTKSDMDKTINSQSIIDPFDKSLFSNADENIKNLTENLLAKNSPYQFDKNHLMKTNDSKETINNNKKIKKFIFPVSPDNPRRNYSDTSETNIINLENSTTSNQKDDDNAYDDEGILIGREAYCNDNAPGNINISSCSIEALDELIKEAKIEETKTPKKFQKPSLLNIEEINGEEEDYTAGIDENVTEINKRVTFYNKESIKPGNFDYKTLRGYTNVLSNMPFKFNTAPDENMEYHKFDYEEHDIKKSLIPGFFRNSNFNDKGKVPLFDNNTPKNDSLNENCSVFGTKQGHTKNYSHLIEQSQQTYLKHMLNMTGYNNNTYSKTNHKVFDGYNSKNNSSSNVINFNHNLSYANTTHKSNNSNNIPSYYKSQHRGSFNGKNNSSFVYASNCSTNMTNASLLSNNLNTINTVNTPKHQKITSDHNIITKSNASNVFNFPGTNGQQQNSSIYECLTPKNQNGYKDLRDYTLHDDDDNRNSLMGIPNTTSNKEAKNLFMKSKSFFIRDLTPTNLFKNPDEKKELFSNTNIIGKNLLSSMNCVSNPSSTTNKTGKDMNFFNNKSTFNKKTALNNGYFSTFVCTGRDNKYNMHNFPYNNPLFMGGSLLGTPTNASTNANISETPKNTTGNSSGSGIGTLDFSKHIVIENIISGKDKRTTIMLRNIPLKYNIQNLADELNQSFSGKIDYINMPINLDVSSDFTFSRLNSIMDILL